MQSVKTGDIFISYSRRDREWVSRFVPALQKLGWSLWWDLQIRTGADFQDAIEAQLDASRAVLVVWSQDSRKSHWVRNEAEAGRLKNALVPVRIDSSVIPLGFRHLQTADLSGWEPLSQSEDFDSVVEALRHLAPVGQASEESQLLDAAGGIRRVVARAAQQMNDGEMEDSTWRLTFNTKRASNAGSKRIHLLAGGGIGRGRNNNEHTWRLTSDGKLEFVQSDGRTHSRFVLDATGKRWDSESDPSLGMKTPVQYITREVGQGDAEAG